MPFSMRVVNAAAHFGACLAEELNPVASHATVASDGRARISPPACEFLVAPTGHRRPASHVDRISKGAKAGDLPVGTPEQFQLLVNLKTANAMGVTIPPSVLARAETVVE